MHKKSIETTHTSPNKATSTIPTPPQEKTVEKTKEEDKEKRTKDPKSEVSKEELRENSIAVLRAKAQAHNAKMLCTVSDRPNNHVTHKEEAEDDQPETTEVEKTT